MEFGWLHKFREHWRKSILLTFIWLVLLFLFKLLEDAILGWINNQIFQRWGAVMDYVIRFALPALASLLVIYLVYRLGKRSLRQVVNDDFKLDIQIVSAEFRLADAMVNLSKVMAGESPLTSRYTITMRFFVSDSFIEVKSICLVVESESLTEPLLLPMACDPPNITNGAERTAYANFPNAIDKDNFTCYVRVLDILNRTSKSHPCVIGSQEKQDDDCDAIVEELLSITDFPFEPVFILRVFYDNREQLAKGLYVESDTTSPLTSKALHKLNSRDIVRIEQRKVRIYGSDNTKDAGYWVLTDLGNKLILYLENNPQVLDKEGSRNQ